MADLIKIKGGIGAVPTLQDRELGYSKDERALYIGTDGENERLCGVNDISNINTLLEAINKRIDEITARLETPSE